MPQEKLPKDYDPASLQKVIERLGMTISGVDRKRSQELYDTSQELKEAIADLEKKITEKINTLGGERAPVHAILPVPQKLKVYEYGLWGWAKVDPFLRWKYIGKIQGYEFYGSQNEDFIPQPDPYVQTGYHYGTGPNDTYLNTEDPTGDGTFVLDTRLVQPTTDLQTYPDGYELTLENVTQETSGTIILGAYHPQFRYKPYRIRVAGVKWNNGDKWRIENYPQNKLFSVGGFSTFRKWRGNFWVKARTIGKGNAMSDFTDAERSTGLTSSFDLSTPTIVQPIHSDGQTCPLVDGYPKHPTLGKLMKSDGSADWSDIVAGTRETDHYHFFGFDWCNVEIVYNTVAEDDGTENIYYRVKRSGLTVGSDIDNETGLD